MHNIGLRDRFGLVWSSSYISVPFKIVSWNIEWKESNIKIQIELSNLFS